MIVKIDSRGHLDANWQQIAELADEYDRGCRSEDACQSKIISLVFDRGYDEAMKNIEEMHQRTVLLMSCTGGNA